jgi:hypothetical protein
MTGKIGMSGSLMICFIINVTRPIHNGTGLCCSVILYTQSRKIGKPNNLKLCVNSKAKMSNNDRQGWYP